MINLIDQNSKSIILGDIIKAENLKTKETFYYLYSRNYLYRYDKSGNIDEERNNNIAVDDILTLVNDGNWKWTNLGHKEDIYKDLFNK
ncbi:hypothetical protein [Candidatus Clostridium radicumherbarum]|uniref:Uncharacterized protein n=1 Tax=Candidatus Clostridium radicumherbarum TaxID=3381662 RepID=A0ABW8TRH6_9CLOT